MPKRCVLFFISSFLCFTSSDSILRFSRLADSIYAFIISEENLTRKSRNWKKFLSIKLCDVFFVPFCVCALRSMVGLGAILFICWMRIGWECIGSYLMIAWIVHFFHSISVCFWVTRSSCALFCVACVCWTCCCLADAKTNTSWSISTCGMSFVFERTAKKIGKKKDRKKWMPHWVEIIFMRYI